MERHKARQRNPQYTLMVLKRQGYPLRRIRRAICILLEVEYSDLVRITGETRMSISHHLFGRRHTREVQEAIASYLGVNRADFFMEES
jgi:hypothetical protein